MGAQCKSDVKQLIEIGSAQRMEPGLLVAVPDILDHQKRLVEKNLLSLDLPYIVLVGAFTSISVVPIKSLDAHPVYHSCILS